MALSLASCSSSQEEKNSCVGKTVKSIEENYSEVTIYFTDGTAIQMYTYSDPISVNVLK